MIQNLESPMKNIKYFFVSLALLAVIAYVTGCEPLDGDSQDQDQQDTTQQAQQKPDTTKHEQAQPTGDLANRVDSLGDELNQTNDRVSKVQEEMDAVKDMMQTQGAAGITDPEQGYKQGLDLFFNRQYQESQNTFQQLLDANKPEGLQSNDQYWIGECYYGMHNYSAALEAFNKVYSFSSSTKFDDAQMMIGMCYMRMGNASRAKAAFKKLIEKYPDSEYVPRARKMLASI